MKSIFKIWQQNKRISEKKLNRNNLNLKKPKKVYAFATELLDLIYHKKPMPVALVSFYLYQTYGFERKIYFRNSLKELSEIGIDRRNNWGCAPISAKFTNQDLFYKRFPRPEIIAYFHDGHCVAKNPDYQKKIDDPEIKYKLMNIARLIEGGNETFYRDIEERRRDIACDIFKFRKENGTL
jgi:hypothetical protein